MSKHCWVLTRSINAYDQDGDYFVAVFDKEPTILDLAKVLKMETPAGDVMSAVALLEHIRQGGGRRDVEDEWFDLQKVEFGKAFG